jgi:septal ring factor EnvC (AmiA/AmiB activator)
MFFAGLIFCHCVLAASNQAPPAKSMKQLKTIQQDIVLLNNNIQVKKHDEQKIEQSLSTTEVAIHKINEQLTPLTSELKQQQERLQLLQNERERKLFDLKQIQDILSKQIYSAYTNQEFSKHALFLKILLNQESPTKIPRYLEYYNALNNARLAQIKKFRDTLTTLEKNQTDVSKATNTLQLTQIRYREEDQKLRHSLQERQLLLQKIRTEIKSDSNRLAQLKKNAQALESTLQQLAKQQTQSRHRYVNTKAQPFNHYRGQLVWPIQGKIAHRFGSPIENSEISWKGILISAPPLQKVRAVAPGKVIFAQWLRGYGLLMIIDHGENYLTLYGRNNSLYKKVGEVVKGGDIIAEVGSSSGYEQTGLYFEVRYKGKAIDPERWLLA